MDRDISLFGALPGHSLSNLRDKPGLEVSRGLNGATTNDERIRIKRVDHFVEKQAKSMGLHAENLQAHPVTALREPADQSRGLTQIANRSKFVLGKAAQKVRQQGLFDSREGA